MSQDKSDTPPQFVPENQQERWLKYGSNVLLSSVVVILLAVAVVALAQYKPARIDTTSNGVYTLRPQTINMLGKLEGKVHIIGLQTMTKPAVQDQSDDDPISGVLAKIPQDQKVRQVTDLLNEFQAANSKISVEMIDPVTNPFKVDQLISNVTNKYGGEVSKYQDFIKSFDTRVADFKALADKNVKQIQKIAPVLDSTPLDDEEVRQTVGLAIGSIGEVPQKLAELQDDLKKPLATKPPDYKGATDAMQGSMSQISQLLGIVLNEFHLLAGAGPATPATAPTTAPTDMAATTAPATVASATTGPATQPVADTRIPLALRQFMIDSYPDFQKMKDIADQVVSDAGKLPDLKLDTLRQSLQTPDPILVQGDDAFQVITADKLWVNDVRDISASGNAKARFNGEQAVTSAIMDLSLKGDKPIVAFIRNGGEALTTPGFGAMMPGGALSTVADRLRAHNFLVVEKDFGGDSNPEQPESSATDAQLNDKNTVWVVMDQPQGNPMMGESPPPTAMIERVSEHLRAGGGVLVCAEPGADDMHAALNDWGIDFKPSVVAFHEAVKAQAGGDDVLNNALTRQYIFRITDYGANNGADFLKPIQSLPSVFLPMSIVQTHPVAGKKITPILPVPGSPSFPNSWGSATGSMIWDEIQRGSNPTVVFHPDTDFKQPIYGGAVSEQQGGGRLIVIASASFPNNGLVTIVDKDYTYLAPGNAELFTDSVYWLARKPEMIALSASAEDVSRIADMTSAAQIVWWIVILGLLPVGVVAGGAVMYASRRS